MPSSSSEINSEFMLDGALRGAFEWETLEDRPGILIGQVKGIGAKAAFRHESGGHRWQRVPETEKRGRVQTSTVTVAILNVPTEVEVKINEHDLDWKTCRGSGAGGQHRNVTASAVQLTHIPTKLMVRVENERSQHQNRQAALAILRAKLLERSTMLLGASRNADRRGQVGSGQRADKIRTIALQRGQVTHHPTGRTIQAAKYLRGHLDLLWDG